VRFFGKKVIFGVNCINMFTSSFYACRSQKPQKDSQAVRIFCAFVIFGQKTACKTLVKLTLGVANANAARKDKNAKINKKIFNKSVFHTQTKNK